MRARCPCTIRASCWTTRSCPLGPACSRGSSKPACRQPHRVTLMAEPALQDTVASLHELSAIDLIAGYRARQFSPSEVLEDLLAHIAVWEPHLKALYGFDREAARAAARASTERWRKDEPIGALDGV